LELPLYTNAAFVPNPYYSLVNDTAVYFLTWNSSVNNARMTPETDVSFPSYTPINYFFKEAVQAYNASYYNGTTDVSGETDPRYVSSEGYFDSQVFAIGQSEQKNASTTNLYASGPFAIMETVVIGTSQDFNTISHGLPDHHLNIQFKSGSAGSYTLFKDTLFEGFAANKFTSVVSPTLLGNGTTNFNFTSVPDAGFISNSTVVSYIKIKYPHTLDLEGASSFLIYLPDNTSQVKSYLNISDFSASDTVRLYNLTNGTRVTVVQNGANYNALIANTGKEKKCFITSDGNVGNISTLQPVTPSARFTNYATQAADSTFIIVYNKRLLVSATNYKNYRSNNTYGGHHHVVMADIDELYDQFAYGIVQSPLSIKNFSNYLINTYPSPPQNLFLFGKSLGSYICRQNAANYQNNLVCSYGGGSSASSSGPSDVLFTLGLNGGTFQPAIPTGRLSVQSDSTAMLYLTKIGEYENQLNNPPAEWKKQILHFGGGNTSQEQNAFKAYLKAYQDTIQGVYYGGQVTSFFKTSSAPIEITTSSTISNFIDNGISLMTFFGHASGEGFDQNIDDINSYNPIAGHYPFIVGNGCFSGDIHEVTTYTVSSSENYVLSSKGAIGYLGTVTLGIPYALNTYTQEWYNQLSRKSYNKSIGVIMQQTMNAIAPIAAGDPVVSNNCLVTTFEGDPAIKINSESKPDYEIASSDIYFDTKTYSDSVIVYVINTNIGMAINDTVFTQLVRTLPNGTIQTYLARTPAPYYKDTIKFTVFINVSTDLGINQFKVTLDAYNQVNELSKSNNTAETSLLINGRGIVPVYPYQFAIVPTDTVTLKASTINPFEKVQNYVFEFDTIDTYNSPFLQRTKISSPGGVVKWLPTVKFTDSTVYYWRVSPDSTDKGNGFIWYESSFQYITNKTGWEQAHFFQFKNDGYQYTQFNRSQRKFNFANSTENVECHNGIYPFIPWQNIDWKLNGGLKVAFGCNGYNPDISVAVFNPIDASNVLSPIVANPMSSANNGVYGEAHCRDSAQRAFDFLVGTPAQRNYLINFLNNSSVIPKGYYVLIYSINNVDFPVFEPALIQAFQSVGSSHIATVPANVPYILWGRKGDPIGSATEIIGSSSTSIIDLNTTFNTNWTNGTISSPVIGPSRKWGSFHWRQRSLGGQDNISIQLIGIKADSSETRLATFPKDSIDILNLGVYVNAAVYPNIRLVATMSDTVLHIPPQMKRWQVIYDPVPEGAVDPPLGFYVSNDSLQIGQSVTIHTPFQNVSNIAFQDSLLFTYWSEDANGNHTYLPSKFKKQPLMPYQTIIDTLTVNTLNYQNTKALWVEVNPVNQHKSQPEQYHFNNIARIPVVIKSDNTNPLLDVTFDGIHILNNDIVSAKPDILISLKDENKFLALNDTGDFKVFLQASTSSVATEIYFGKELTFTPAVLPNNSCKVNYSPTLSDGNYQLIVQAKDRSNNQSGAVDYKINFTVVNKSTITEVMNYPNPFTTSTRFVFTLTGSVIPTYFKIQIYNIEGKVVREINEDELGYIHIGRNITDYAWNGKDQFGDQLANGIYLYRVVTSINGQAIQEQSTGADQYFKHSFGKMYLMR